MTISTPSSSASGNIMPAVDDDDVVAIADGHQVHAELAQSAQRHNVKLLDQTSTSTNVADPGYRTSHGDLTH